jgi:hypothetical protein
MEFRLELVQVPVTDADVAPAPDSSIAASR